MQPGRGCYALPGTSADVVAAANLDAVVSCVSAVREHGLEVLGDRSIVHCSIPRSRGSSRRVPSGVVRHQEDIVTVPGRRVASIECAVARAARCLSYGGALAMLDQVGRQRGRDCLDRILVDVARSHPGLARDLGLDVDPSSRSHIETFLRWALRSAGYSVAAGVFLPGIGEVDLLVEGVLIVELDGYAYHSGRSEFCSDRRRDRRALRLGSPTLRFPYEDSSPEGAIPEITLQLEAVGGKPYAFASSVPAEVRAEVGRIRAAALGPTSRQVGRPYAAALLVR